ncbi:MAG: 4a-hydroxytetrahydrobiopterin dehydratase [Candidatus Marinimicrobia bacterium]|nr:4a-hydroxytetrahydrobiopterin dehydratase [Candidatus Neomarinimicrobiota bacterium]
MQKSLSGQNWQYREQKINKGYTFDSYMDGISFINNIAKLAEAHNNHPDLKIGYCKVTVSISSHDLGGVSTKCVNLALDIDRVLENS